MRIQSSDLHLQASHRLEQTRIRRQEMEFWTTGARAAPPPAETRTAAKPAAAPVPAGSQPAEAQVELSPRDRLIADLVRRMIRTLTGKDWTLHIPDPSQAAAPGAAAADAAPPPPAAATPPSAGFGLVIDSFESYEESETLRFRAEGSVKAADGREFQVQLELTMDRSFYAEQSATLRLGDAKRVDPLVVNLGSGGVQLEAGARFEFDLDADGSAESLASLSTGSGFLARDADGDGRVGDGRELFGAISGDGFAELAGYDADGNGFIDAGDRVFGELRVWQKGAQVDRLLTLEQAGIGALYLGRQDGSFRLTDSTNEGLGEVRSTGLYLREDGGSGSLQQIDYLA